MEALQLAPAQETQSLQKTVIRRITMLTKLKSVLARVTPDIDMNTVTEATTLIDDLGFDSLAIMMMSMEIEDAFGFKFTEFVRFETVGDVCKYLEEKLG